MPQSSRVQPMRVENLGSRARGSWWHCGAQLTFSPLDRVVPPTLGESLPTLMNLEKPSQACSEVLLLGDSSLHQVHSSNHHTSPVALQALQTDIPNLGQMHAGTPGMPSGKQELPEKVQTNSTLHVRRHSLAPRAAPTC